MTAAAPTAPVATTNTAGNVQVPTKNAPRGKKRAPPKPTAEGVATKRTKNTRPKPPAPPPASCQFIDLPSEVLCLVAAYIIGPDRDDGEQLIGPLETPYPPRRKLITSAWKPRPERFGVVPSRVYDLLSFAQCCRKAYQASLPFTRLLDGSRPTAKEEAKDETKVEAEAEAVAVAEVEGKGKGKETLDAAVLDPALGGRSEPVGSGKERVFLRMSHRGENTADELVKRLIDNRGTVKEVVIHSCGNHDGHYIKKQGPIQRNPKNGLSRTKPLQEHAKDQVVLPNLASIQLGPDLCLTCIRVCLRLLLCKSFYKTPKVEGGLPTEWHLELSDGWAVRRATPTTYAHHPSPALRMIQMIMPEVSPTERGAVEADRIRTLLRECVPDEVGKGIETFSVILRAGLDRRWGGFGVNGTTTRVLGRTKEQAEQDLAARANILMRPPGTSARQKMKEDKDKDAVSKKYETLAKAAKAARGKQRATGPEDDLVAAAVAAVSTIKSKEPKVTVASSASVPVEATVEPTPIPANTLAAQVGAPSNSEPVIRSANPDPGDELYDANGQLIVRPSYPLEDDAFHVKPERVDDGSDEDEHSATNGDDAGDKLTRSERQIIANHIHMADHFSTILTDIVRQFPNLLALQVVRGGGARVDLLEGADSIDNMARMCVWPLQGAKTLKHLDLGLAIIGRREVRDFPLGMTFPDVDANVLGPVRARTQLLRQRLHQQDIKRAVGEGDAWRKRVIERFVLGKADPEAGQGTASGSYANTNTNSNPYNGIGMPVVAETPGVWPSSIERGSIYSPDILDRGRFKGFLTSWERDVARGKTALKWKRDTVLL